MRTSNGRETIRHDTTPDRVSTQVSAIVGDISECPEVGIKQRVRDGGGRDERTPASGVEVTSDTVIRHHAPRTNVDAEHGIPEGTVLHTAIPEGGSRRVAHERGNLKLVVGIGRKGVCTRHTVTTETVNRVSKGRRSESENMSATFQ